MSENSEILGDREIGERLRIAREGARITQAAAAQAISAARTTIVALEPVSYTHLDVYKRQDQVRAAFSGCRYFATAGARVVFTSTPIRSARE